MFFWLRKKQTNKNKQRKRDQKRYPPAITSSSDSLRGIVFYRVLCLFVRLFILCKTVTSVVMELSQ